MNARELFGVIVRTIGLILILDGIQIAANIEPWISIIIGVVYVVVGFIFIAGADMIVRLCYRKAPQ